MPVDQMGHDALFDSPPSPDQNCNLRPPSATHLQRQGRVAKHARLGLPIYAGFMRGPLGFPVVPAEAGERADAFVTPRRAVARKPCWGLGRRKSRHAAEAEMSGHRAGGAL